MTNRQYGHIQGHFVMVGYVIQYWNKYNQEMFGLVTRMFVEEPDTVMVKRKCWPTEECINLNDYKRWRSVRIPRNDDDINKVRNEYGIS